MTHFILSSSFNNDALHSLVKLVSGLSFNEIVIMGHFNLNWLHSVADDFKCYCRL